MNTPRIDLGPIAYDPDRKSYDAPVTITGKDGAATYDCALTFPTDAPIEVVVEALVRQARELHRNRNVPVVSRFGPTPGRVISLRRRRRTRQAEIAQSA